MGLFAKRSETERPYSLTEPLPFGDIGTLLAALAGAGDSGAVEAVDALLVQAALHRASDVHLEPWDEGVSLRFRIDGLLHEIATLPLQHHARLAGRVKVLARMLTYQKDLPQDGRIDPEASGCGKAVRVSTFPTVNGEKLVLRVLNPDPNLFDLEVLGLDADTTTVLRGVVARPQGAFLLTGPASSGKTTTIYAMIREILGKRGASTHVVAIEDPVEYRLGRVSQSEVNPHTGFTYEAALRAALRQDPEVIVLGEIRDPETARTAIQAGLTGHLVISTIHSGTAAGVFTRLLDMGVEPYLAASSVAGVMAQRLYRRICPDCKTDAVPAPRERLRYGLADGASVCRPTGCPACQGIGHRGRAALGEVLMVDEALEALLQQRPRTHTLHEAAVAAGMLPLFEQAARCVRARLTSPEEMDRLFPAPGAGGHREE